MKEQVEEKKLYKDTLCRCLQMLFRIDYYRLAFYKLNGVESLVNYLNASLTSTTSKDQMQYQVIHCIWLLTFNEQIASRIQNNHMVIPVLADILNSTEKEKVKRIIVATLRNLLEKVKTPETIKNNCLCMLQSKVKKLLEIMQQVQTDDPEINEDVEFLDKKLETLVMDVSSFDEYTLEITSNRLSWSPAHKSDKFWRENAQKLNENNFFLIRKLIEMLKNEQTSSQFLEIVLNDIGQYVRYYSRGKNVIEQLDGKTIVMSMLSHQNSDVRHQALLCIQKLMVHHWEYLSKIDDSNNENHGASVVESKA
jgi:V-type H+-transporting ATPase subunit H